MISSTVTITALFFEFAQLERFFFQLVFTFLLLDQPYKESLDTLQSLFVSIELRDTRSHGRAKSNDLAYQDAEVIDD